MKKIETQKKIEWIGSHESGFSLIELLVSLVIFLVVTGTIFGVMQVAQRSRTTINQQVPMNKSLRFALNLLGRDTYNAGYAYPLRSTVVLPDLRVSTLLETPADSNSSRDTMPPIITGNNLRPNSLNPTPNAKTDQVTFLYKDSSFNNKSGFSTPLNINAATTTAGIDEIVPVTGENDECTVNDVFLVVGNTGSTIGVVTGLSGIDKVQFANGDILNLNKTGPSGNLRKITTPATMFRVFIVTFFVTEDGTLIRREFGNRPTTELTGGYVDEPLVYGVQDFQVQYVMDDGTLTDSPTEDEINLAAIRQVRYTISARSYDTDATGEAVTTTMSTTFSTRNLGYDAN
jgi:prepilin-type N-terminal cleavage/methylation domain-containing protein